MTEEKDKEKRKCETQSQRMDELGNKGHMKTRLDCAYAAYIHISQQQQPPPPPPATSRKLIMTCKASACWAL
jgi:hypothetical protein